MGRSVPRLGPIGLSTRSMLQCSEDSSTRARRPTMGHPWAMGQPLEARGGALGPNNARITGCMASLFLLRESRFPTNWSVINCSCPLIFTTHQGTKLSSWQSCNGKGRGQGERAKGERARGEGIRVRVRALGLGLRHLPLLPRLGFGFEPNPNPKPKRKISYPYPFVIALCDIIFYKNKNCCSRDC